MINRFFPDYRIILASSSPRRIMLLKGVDIDFTVEPNHNSDEEYDQEMEKTLVPEHLARQKSFSFGRDLKEREVLITADTMVLCEGDILGKPVSKEDAVNILKKLSGKKHTVLTGVCLRSTSHTKSFTCSTDVWFKDLSLEEINYYIDNYNPFDKAGAYGAQEWIGYIAISHIDGSYFNVMGLPVHTLYSELYKFLSLQKV
jgi:septum formation protein